MGSFREISKNTAKFLEDLKTAAVVEFPLINHLVWLQWVPDI